MYYLFIIVFAFFFALKLNFSRYGFVQIIQRLRTITMKKCNKKESERLNKISKNKVNLVVGLLN